MFRDFFCKKKYFSMNFTYSAQPCLEYYLETYHIRHHHLEGRQ